MAIYPKQFRRRLKVAVDDYHRTCRNQPVIIPRSDGGTSVRHCDMLIKFTVIRTYVDSTLPEVLPIERMPSHSPLRDFPLIIPVDAAADAEPPVPGAATCTTYCNAAHPLYVYRTCLPALSGCLSVAREHRRRCWVRNPRPWWAIILFARIPVMSLRLRASWFFASSLARCLPMCLQLPWILIIRSRRCSRHSRPAETRFRSLVGGIDHYSADELCGMNARQPGMWKQVGRTSAENCISGVRLLWNYRHLPSWHDQWCDSQIMSAAGTIKTKVPLFWVVRSLAW